MLEFWTILTRYASSWISEISRTLESLEGVNRSTRPEHESRVDAVSRDLQSLRLLATQKQPANSDTINSATLTEADVKIFRVRLASLTHSEDVLIADTIVSAHRVAEWSSSASVNKPRCTYYSRRSKLVILY